MVSPRVFAVAFLHLQENLKKQKKMYKKTAIPFFFCKNAEIARIAKIAKKMYCKAIDK